MNLIEVRQKIESGVSLYELPLRVVYYARVSTDKDVQLNSLQNQTAYYEKLIREKPMWVFAGAYVDEGVSGTSAERRDSFQRMIRDASQNAFDLIVTKEISRFSRNTLDSIQYTRRLLRYGVGVYFQNDGINTLMPDAELRLTIMASLAQDEVRRLSERVRFGFRQAQEQHVVLGQNNLYGYEKTDGRLTVKESEAAVVREIFARYVRGEDGLRRISRLLEEEGIYAPNGRPFGYSTLCGILRNPKYKGCYAGRKYTTEDYRSGRILRRRREDWLVEKDESIPAIVDEGVWDEANALLDRRGSRVKEHEGGFSNRYRYSGRLLCAEHNTAFHRHVMKNKSGERECWSCRMYRLKGKAACDSPTLYSDELDELFARLFGEIRLDRERIVSELAARYREPSSDAGEKTRAELDRIAKKKEKLLELAVDGLLSNREFYERNQALNERQAALEAELGALSRRLSDRQDRGRMIRRMHELLADDRLTGGELTELLVDRIYVKKEADGRVRLNILLTDDPGGLPKECENGILSCEIGISQAQVSRLEKGALERIRRQLA